MNYQKEELTKARSELKKRRLVIYIPFGLLVAAAIVAFILTRNARMAQGWLIVSGILILAGAFFIFFWDLYIKPIRNYAKHVDTMLNGRLRTTKGLMKEFCPDLIDREGLRCRAVWLSVGDLTNEEDDRLFYLEQRKTLPPIAPGTPVTVVSNDNMIGSLTVD